MTKVKCACTECKYINRQGNCSLKQINLSQWGVNTKNMGFKNFNECCQYEMSEKWVKIKQQLDEIMKNDNSKEDK